LKTVIVLEAGAGFKNEVGKFLSAICIFIDDFDK